MFVFNFCLLIQILHPLPLTNDLLYLNYYQQIITLGTTFNVVQRTWFARQTSANLKPQLWKEKRQSFRWVIFSKQKIDKNISEWIQIDVIIYYQNQQKWNSKLFTAFEVFIAYYCTVDSA